MNVFKRIVKRNSHNGLFRLLAKVGKNANKLYENLNHNHETNGELQLIKKLGKMNLSIMVDGGANKGAITNYLHQYSPNATIYCFEPVNETFEKLKHRFESVKNIHPIRFGLFSEKIEKTIHKYTSSTHSSIYHNMDPSTQTGTEIIELLKGDDWMKENNITSIDFLKLDLEGADLEALKGFENAIKEKKIRIIQFEYGTINIKTRDLLYNYYQFFKKHGYIIGKIYPKKVEFREYEFKHEDFLGSNFIAVHSSDTNAIQTLSKS